jgi:hypothetical protein
MTTKVIVDAHAGWPVLVTSIEMHPETGEWSEGSFTVVSAGTKQDFYIYDTRQLLISEMSKNDPAGASRET